MQKVVVTKEEAGQRLDHFLGKYLKEAPKSFYYKMLRKKNIVLNGKKAAGMERLYAGDEIKFFLSDETMAKFRDGTEPPELSVQQGESFLQPESMGKTGTITGENAILEGFAEIMVIYEDEQVLVLNKPAGVLSQKADRRDMSLVEWISRHIEKEIGEQNVFKPGICNRLDRNTTGLIVAGKTALSLQYFNELFRERDLKKYYLCLVKGKVEQEKKMEGYLKKSEIDNQVQVTRERQNDSVKIETAYVPSGYYRFKGQEYTLLKVYLITGKSHQIRAHLKSIGHPVAGDPKYGDHKINQRLKKDFAIRFQMLHAWKLLLGSPDYLPEKYHGMEWTAPLPVDFERVLLGMEKE